MSAVVSGGWQRVARATQTTGGASIEPSSISRRSTHSTSKIPLEAGGVHFRHLFYGRLHIAKMRQKHFAEAARLLSLPGRMSPVNEKA